MELVSFVNALHTVAFAWFAAAFVGAMVMFFVSPKSEEHADVKTEAARERRAA